MENTKKYSMSDVETVYVVLGIKDGGGVSVPLSEIHAQNKAHTILRYKQIGKIKTDLNRDR